MKRLLLLLACVLLVFLVSHALAAQADPMLEISPSLPNTVELYTGEQSQMMIRLGGTFVPRDARLEITVPDYLVNSLTVSAESMVGWTQTESVDNGLRKFTITHDGESGGVNMAFYLEYKPGYKSGQDPNLGIMMPDGQQVPFEVKYYVPGDAQPALTDSLTLTYHVLPVTFLKGMRVNRSFDTTTHDGQTIVGGMENPEKPGYIHPIYNEYVSFGYKAYHVPPPEGVGRTLADGVGTRVYDVVITETVPPEAEFVANVNSQWTYDAQSRVATFQSQRTLRGSYEDIAVLHLLYPGAKIGEHTNTASITLSPLEPGAGETATQLTDSITFNLTAQLPKATVLKYAEGGGSPIYDQITAKQWGRTFRIDITNLTRNVPLTFTLRDFGLDERLKMTGLMFSSIRKVLPYQLDVTVTTWDGDTITYLNQGDNTRIPLDKTPKEISVRTSPGSTLVTANSITDPGVLSLSFFTTFTDPVSQHHPIPKPEYGGKDYLFNSMTAQVTFPDITLPGETTPYTLDFANDAAVLFEPYDPRVTMSKRVQNPQPAGTPFLTNARVTYSIYSSAYLLPPDTVNGQVIVDLLPEGFLYEEGSARNGTSGSGSPITPIVEENYRGTGRTALLFSMNSDLFQTGDFTFNAIVGPLAPKGTATNLAFLAWSNNGEGSPDIQQVLPGAQSGLSNPPVEGTDYVLDTYDLDQDGNVAEPVLFSSADVLVQPNQLLISTKQVKGSLDQAFGFSDGHAVPGGEVEYQLTISNYRDTPIPAGLVVVDTLPRLGDMRLEVDNDNQPMERGSQFDVLLRAALTADPEMWEVSYSTDEPVLPTRAYTGNAGLWIAAPTAEEISLVRAVKLISKQEIPAGASVTVPISAIVQQEPTPETPVLLQGKQAFNSFAVSEDGLKFMESNQSSAVITGFSVLGFAYVDMNSNGLLDGSGGVGAETFASGVTVRLLDAGTLQPVLGADNQPLETVTQADGTYRLDVPQAGTYVAAFGAYPQHSFSGVAADTAVPGGNHVVRVQDGVGYTAPFTLSTGALQLRRNAAYIGRYLLLVKMWDLSAAQEPYPTARFQIWQDQQPFETVELKGSLQESMQERTFGPFPLNKPDGTPHVYDITEIPSPGGEFFSLALPKQPITETVDHFTFFNIVTSTDPLIIPVAKKLTIAPGTTDGGTPRVPKAGEFTFELFPMKAELVSPQTGEVRAVPDVLRKVTAAIDENGVAEFSNFLALRDLGEIVYFFAVGEQIPAQREAGMVYDASLQYGSVTARYEGDQLNTRIEVGDLQVDSNGQMSIVPKADSLVFTNQYQGQSTPPETPSYPAVQVPLTAKKTLRNGALQAGQFTFVLRGGDGQVLAEAVNGADGAIVFPERAFSKEVSGWVYTISERQGQQDGIAYDSTVYTVKVTTRAEGERLKASVSLEKDGVPYDGEMVFTNQQTLPPTGDSMPTLILLLLLGALVLGAAAYLRYRKPKDK